MLKHNRIFTPMSVNCPIHPTKKTIQPQGGHCKAQIPSRNPDNSRKKCPPILKANGEMHHEGFERGKPFGYRKIDGEIRSDQENE